MECIYRGKGTILYDSSPSSKFPQTVFDRNGDSDLDDLFRHHIMCPKWRAKKPDWY